jgi:DNA-binding GntR family transcriptional regulator
VRLSDKAHHLIRHKIVTLELTPLSAIDEQALMEDLQLGRTPIREALQRLAAEGFVFFAPRRGIFVADISITDLQKIFELRVVLEGFCAQLASQRATEDQLAEMEATVVDLRQVPDGDSRALMAVDERFHHLLYKAAGNEFLFDILTRLHAKSFRLWYLVLDRLDGVEEAMEQHVAITEALRARDGQRAEELIQRHISDFQREIKEVV